MDPILEQELAELSQRARRIPFFTLVRHLERRLPAGARVAGTGPAGAEAIRFRHDIQPIFHASDVTDLRVLRGGEGARVEVTTSFLGVVGSVSPLANYFTEEILRAQSVDDELVRAFYDLFHHRLIAFVFAAAQRASPWAEIRADGSDRVTRRSLYFTGLTERSPRLRGFDAGTWLGLARVVARRPRTRDALEHALVAGFPAIPIRVVDFLSRDVGLPVAERSQLGVRHCTLGRGARLGSKLLRQSGFIRLAVGPVDRAAYDALVPGTPGHTRLRSIVSSVTGGMLDVDVEIEVKRGEEPRARLAVGRGARLGVDALVVRPRSDRALLVRVPLTDGEGVSDGEGVAAARRGLSVARA